MRTQQFALLSGLIHGAVAATPTTSVTSIFLPGFDTQSLVASVITAAPTATEYFLQCDSGNLMECGVGTGMTVTEGPSTFGLEFNGTDIAISEACALSGDNAVCTFSTPGGNVSTESGSGVKSMFLEVTITAGFAALSSASAAAASAAAAAAVKTEAVEPKTTATAPTASSTSKSDTASETANGMGSAATRQLQWDMTVLLGLVVLAGASVVL
ncbi:hypothetical protein JX266_001924 [Neoarthrinium moseri]|nr:hypothetical protein JX266_001924 [Neoarthrinium moseri]